MGKRSRQSFIKRAKEKKRQEKAAAKRKRRLERRRGEVPDALPTATGADVMVKSGALDSALVLVGLQNDFLPGGVLGVAGGAEVLPVANLLIEEFSLAALPIVATRCWHSPSHSSFTEQGGPWPPHCVADTPGADFYPELRLPNHATVVTMGTEPHGDSLSVFRDSDLAEQLRALGVARIVICGLATEYGVKATAVDGRRQGFEVTVVQEGIRGVDEDPGDSVEALREMERAGVRIATAGTLVSSRLF
jgi:nicotinamidase/pyrazinamidase